MPRSQAVVVVAAAFLSCGCAVPRAVFPAMPGTADALGDREAFYEAHRSLDVVGTPNAGQQLGWAADPRFPMLVLADGQQVSNVRDLVPVVDPSSPTAKAIAAADDAAVAADVAWSASLLGMTTGLMIALSSPLFLVDGDERLGATLVTYVGGSALALASAFTVGVAEFFAEEAEAQRAAAMVLYDRDLRARLGLPRVPALASAPEPPMPTTTTTTTTTDPAAQSSVVP